MECSWNCAWSRSVWLLPEFILSELHWTLNVIKIAQCAIFNNNSLHISFVHTPSAFCAFAIGEYEICIWLIEFAKGRVRQNECVCRLNAKRIRPELTTQLHMCIIVCIPNGRPLITIWCEWFELDRENRIHSAFIFRSVIRMRLRSK